MPPEDHWDISQYSYLRVDFTNRGKGLVLIDGRLDNNGAQDWHNSTNSLAYIMPGETETLGFPFPRSWSENDAPEIFNQLSGKPNGHRTHWKQFDPKNVKSLKFRIRSTVADIKLDNISASLCYPYGVEPNEAFMELPYLDEFGQVRKRNWPGKLKSLEELKTRFAAEDDLPPNPVSTFNQYGGWKHGPNLNSTGYFRTQKVDGKWWLVDPMGKLFFSQGLNSVGLNTSTPFKKDLKPLFGDLPPQNDPLYKTMIRWNKGTARLSYFRGNQVRVFGEQWKPKAFNRIHRRLHNWGINTIGAWSDPELKKPSPSGEQSAYTPQVHVLRSWDTRITPDTPDPFDPKFANHVAQGLRPIAEHSANDPWCLGVFIDNETDWPNDLVELVFSSEGPRHARQAFAAILKKKYSSVEDLNSQWKTNYDSWEAVEKQHDLKSAVQRKSDFELLYFATAQRYYQTCRDELRKAMPNHLYLGSRIHKCPTVVAQACAKYTDVYSLNLYESRAGTGNLTAGADVPVLISEYHFAAPDRGIEGVGLFPVGNQIQRARSFVGYTVAGLTNSKVVGAHWFAYVDQPATGRPYENYQIGFVDVTDTPYPIMTRYARQLAEQMYRIGNESPDDLDALERLWK